MKLWELWVVYFSLSLFVCLFIIVVCNYCFFWNFEKKFDNLSMKWKVLYGISLKDIGWVVFFLEVDGYGIVFI